MTTSRRTPMVREMIGELLNVLALLRSDIEPPDTLEHEEPGQVDVLYLGHTMRIIVEERDP